MSLKPKMLVFWGLKDPRCYFFLFELPTFQTQHILYFFSLLFSLYWFFSLSNGHIFYTSIYFFSFWEEEEKQPYISNNRIFQRSYSFNINSIISSLISFKSNPIIVSLNNRFKKKKRRSLLCHLEVARIQFEVGNFLSLGGSRCW